MSCIQHLSRHDETSDNDSTTNNTNMTLLQLPSELLRHVYSFMDVPMLGKMAKVHNHGILRDLANAELLWGSLVQQRFQIATTNTNKRPKAFGGKDWKDSYRSMHLCNRMPKCRHTNRKTVFAKGKSEQQQLSVWVTLHHTENCRTRVLRTSNATNRQQRQRYVDFWVCLQNVKTSGPAIRVDVHNAQLQFLGGLGALYSESCVQEEWNCGGYGRWVLPRVLYKHSTKTNHNHSAAATVCNENKMIAQGGIWLKPLEFCMVSLPFACAQDCFETDVLARTVSLILPFSTSTSASTTSEAEAWFVPESVVWDHYCELPGGCLTLSDRERRLHL